MTVPEVTRTLKEMHDLAEKGIWCYCSWCPCESCQKVRDPK